MERSDEDVGNGLVWKRNMDENLSSPSRSSNPSLNDKQKGVENKKKEEEEKDKFVPFLKLFSFADSYDYMLMFVGSIGGIGNGAGMPLMTVLFGELINTFGSNQGTHDIVSAVSKVTKIYNLNCHRKYQFILLNFRVCMI